MSQVRRSSFAMLVGLVALVAHSAATVGHSRRAVCHCDVPGFFMSSRPTFSMAAV
jgi:hypothetical protein